LFTIVLQIILFTVVAITMTRSF